MPSFKSGYPNCASPCFSIEQKTGNWKNSAWTNDNRIHVTQHLPIWITPDKWMPTIWFIVVHFFVYSVEHCGLWGSVFDTCSNDSWKTKCHCLAHWAPVGQTISFPYPLLAHFQPVTHSICSEKFVQQAPGSCKITKDFESCTVCMDSEFAVELEVDHVETVQLPMINCSSIKLSFRLQLPLRPWSPHLSPPEYVCQQLCTSGWTTGRRGKGRAQRTQ